MKVWEIGERFGLDALRMAERPSPPLGPRQARLRVRAVSLNFRDVLIARGQYNPKIQLPLVPVSDGVGEVVEVGDGARRVRPGDRVLPMATLHWVDGQPDRRALRSTIGGDRDGMLAEEVVFDEQALVHAPTHLSDVEAATLPCAALTAWSALVTMGGLSAGDTVLAQGTGGVSIFALQLARMLGARVIVTSSRDDKLARARELGASLGINYMQDARWGETAKAFTAGQGVDHVVEIGGAGTLQQSLRAVRPGGTISLIGVLAGGARDVDLTPVVMHDVRVQGVFLGHRHGFEALCRAVAHRRLRPVVDRVFELDDAPAALDHLARAQHFGKVCIRVCPASSERADAAPSPDRPPA